MANASPCLAALTTYIVTIQCGAQQAAITTGSLVPLVIQPRTTLARAAAQQSVLTLVPKVQLPLVNQAYLQELHATMVPLPAAWEDDMRRLCDGVGLSRPYLFRDLDSLGVDLKDRFKRNALSPSRSLALRERLEP